MKTKKGRYEKQSFTTRPSLLDVTVYTKMFH